MADSNWDNDVFKHLATDYIKEKKRKRRWGIFFKLAFLILFILLITLIYSNNHSDNNANKPHAALIDIRGPIFAGNGNDADNIAKGLNLAFEDKNTKGVVLRINSPGGSPVQADYIYNEIVRLRKEHPKIKVYAVCTDSCASAAYYIAAAADDIYANPASIVGSIGVLYDGFGFTGAMQKLGVDRRLITAGKNKGFLDPFSPLKPQEEVTLRGMLDQIHLQFEEKVKEGRGNRLKNDPDLFSGLFWTGANAKKLGLIDGFGSPGYVIREVIKVKYTHNYTVKPSYFERFTKQFSTAFSNVLLSKMGIGDSAIVSQMPS